MQIVSLGNYLHEISDPVFQENNEISPFVVCLISPESGKG